MISTGADAQGVEAALEGVRQMSWADGRTLRPKYLVLLAFAEVRIAPLRAQDACMCVRQHVRIMYVAAVQSTPTGSYASLTTDGYFSKDPQGAGIPTLDKQRITRRSSVLTWVTECSHIEKLLLSTSSPVVPALFLKLMTTVQPLLLHSIVEVMRGGRSHTWELVFSVNLTTGRFSSFVLPPSRMPTTTAT